jgi:hypothetical protein
MANVYDSSNLLKEYASRREIAESLKVCPRTIDRYVDKPDGLPVTKIGGRNYFHIPTARTWVASLTRQRNPRRVAVAGRKPREATHTLLGGAPEAAGKSSEAA